MPRCSVDQEPAVLRIRIRVFLSKRIRAFLSGRIRISDPDPIFSEVVPATGLEGL